MGRLEQARTRRVEAWLARGGHVIASSTRAARAIAAAYHAERIADGRLAWTTPAIFAWDEWLRERWLELSGDGRLLLAPLQELALWKRVMRGRPAVEGVQHLDRLAKAAQRAHALLADYAPAMLKTAARLGWSGDAEVFSQWLTDFDSACQRESAMSAARLPWAIEAALRGSTVDGPRPPLLLVGFDRLLVSQRAVLDAWSGWQQDEPAEESARTRHLQAQDADEELRACVRWLHAQQRAQPESRLMVVTTGLAARRGAVERALLDQAVLDAALAGEPSEAALDFEFSLGTPLAHAGPARSALLLLRWIVEPLTEPDLDWLLTSGFCAANEAEEIALAQTMVLMRRAGRERPEWPMDAFCQPDLAELAPPAAYVARMQEAQRIVATAATRQSPMEWVRIAEQALETAGWPGSRPESSVSYQVRERWEAVLEQCAGLGFDGSRISWAEFVSAVSGAVAETIFAAESSDAAIQITEPLTAAGQLADGIWFLGANEENWPGRGQPHPLLPLGLQREAGMPHASHQADWALAQEATVRLLHSAEEVVFSFARHAGEVEMRPSRLIAQQAGPAANLPAEAVETAGAVLPIAQVYEDFSRISFPPQKIAGGAETLTAQSLCPFQAFATKRLNVPEWEPAEAGLNAKQRGQLLHAVLHQVWNGQSGGTAQRGISTHAELAALADGGRLDGFVRKTVNDVMRESFRPGRRSSLPARFPKRLLELEAERLVALVTEWLAYERQRLIFTVAGTERKAEVTVAGLRLNLRLDRVDRLPDGSELVIDYKSSDVGPSAWRGERPDDMQLPLYAATAMQEQVEGLLIAQVRPGEAKLCGRVRNAGETLFHGLTKRDGLVKDPLTDQQMDEWRMLIARLGKDFLAGRAEVAPKDPAKTCQRCGLHTICRIQENAPLATLELDEDDALETSDAKADGGRDA